MARQTLLVYDPDGASWRAKLGPVCALQKMRLRLVETAELDQKVGDLARGVVPAEPASAGEPLPEAIIVLCGLGDKQLDRVLQALRKAGVPSVLKAILTVHNAGWTLRELHGELTKEREAITSGQQPVEHEL